MDKISQDSEESPQAVFPWQKTPWMQLLQLRKQKRLPHALLFVGVDGIGKRQFAHAFANLLLCTLPSDGGVRCEICRGCQLVNANSHPDLLLVEPEETGKTINVDQIREVMHYVNETTLQGGFKIIIINPATAMNVNAANALLKTLEEPAPNTLLILISNQSLRLPATIISRCQKMIFHKPSHADAIAWLRTRLQDDKIDPQLLLKLANDAPLRALSLIENDLLSLRKDVYLNLPSLSTGHADPLLLAVKWQEEDHLCVVDLLLSWLTDLLRYKMTEDPKSLTNSDYHIEIAKVSVRLLKNNLLAYIEHIQQTRSSLLMAINLNKQLLLEDLLIRWTEYVSG
jgi:DNA polymerase-3 subunit delta'